MTTLAIHPFAQRLHRRRRSGVNLLGALLALTLGGLAITGSVAMYNSSREAANKTQSLELLNALRANIEQIYAGNPTFGTADTNLVPILAARGAIPDSALISTSNDGGTPDDADDDFTEAGIQHPFGEAVTVVGNPGGAAATQFRITFTEIDPEICAHLADSYVGRTRARSGIVQIRFEETNVASPITVAQVSTNCASNDGPLDVGFQFG